MTESLNHNDVARLLANPGGEIRAELAGKIAASHSHLNEQERRLAEDIFRVMVRDAEVRVRQALSTQLKDNPLIPHDVAIALARDVEAVSLPMLRFSEVLTDDDLIEIVNSQGNGTREAVAQRSLVSQSVADALVESGDEKAVAALVANEGADISPATLGRVADRYGANDAIGEPLVNRRNLPVTVAERLMARISENLRSHLLGRRDLTPEIATALLIQAREMAVLGLTETQTDVVRLVDHLHRHGRLTPSIILRAVCMGDMVFFETALAKLAGLGVDNARALIYDPGQLGFEAVFTKAGLPRIFFSAMRAAIDVSRDMRYDGEAQDRERFSRRMIERILTQYGDLGVEFETDDLEYLLAKMNGLPAVVPQSGPQP